MASGGLAYCAGLYFRIRVKTYLPSPPTPFPMSLRSECAGNSGGPISSGANPNLERLIFEEAPVGLAQVSTKGVCLCLNRHLRHLLGLEPERERPRAKKRALRFDALVHAPDAEAGRRVRSRLLRGEEPECACELWLRCEDGRRLPARVRTSLVRESGGKPLFFLLAIEPTGEPEAPETPETPDTAPPAAIRDGDLRWKQRCEILIRATRQVMYELDPRTGEMGLIGDVEQLTGYAPDAFSRGWGSWCKRVHRDDLEPLEQRHLSAVVGEPYHLEYRLLRKDGSTVCLRDDGCAISHGKPGGVRLIGALLDVSEQRNLALQLQHAQKMEAFGRLAGGVAHDFNNLLTVFSGYTELLLADFQADDERHEYLEEMQRATQRAVVLTAQLLAFGRLQHASPRMMDMGEVLLDLGRMLRRLIGEDIELVTTVSEEIGPVFADPSQIETVLINLAVNARDAMPHGGRLSIEAANSHLRPNDRRAAAGWTPGPYVQIAVSDTGVGIAPKVRDHIFEPFFTAREPGEGSGLGLSTCCGILEQCGGRIEVESIPGRGSTFRVWLPRMPGHTEEHREIVGRRLPGKLPRGKGETILFVEDDPAVQKIYTTMLRRLGYEVLAGSNGDEAMRIAGTHPEIQLVLTDLVMPIMGGNELAEELRHLIPKVKIVLTSGYACEPGGQVGPVQGTTFIPKPLSRDTLACKLRELIESA